MTPLRRRMIEDLRIRNFSPNTIAGYIGYEVDRGGLDVGVAEQRLDDADVDAELAQVGGEAVAQRVRPHGLVDAGGGQRVGEHLAHRVGAEMALLGAAGEEPGRRRAVGRPVRPQLDQEPLRQQCIAVLLAGKIKVIVSSAPSGTVLIVPPASVPAPRADLALEAAPARTAPVVVPPRQRQPIPFERGLKFTDLQFADGSVSFWVRRRELLGDRGLQEDLGFVERVIHHGDGDDLAEWWAEVCRVTGIAPPAA